MLRQQKKNKHVINPETLGLFFVRDNQQSSWIQESKDPESENITSLYKFITTIAETTVTNQKCIMLRNPQHHTRTLFIDTMKNDPFNFSLDHKMKKNLLESGKNGAINYLKKLNQNSSPLLRSSL